MKNMLLLTLKVEKTGGIQTRIANYCKHLKRFGINPLILSIGNFKEKKSYLLNDCTVYKFPKKHSILFPFFLSSLVKKHNVEILHVLEGYYGPQQLYALLYAKAKGIKCGISCYGGEIKEVLDATIIRDKRLKIYEKGKIWLSFALADKIAANSKSTLENFVNKRFHHKTSIVYPGVNLDLLRFKRVGNKRRNNILTISRLLPRKGHDDLIKAFAVVAKEFPDATLTVVGKEERNYLEKLIGLAKELGIEKRVEFIGEISDLKKLAALYSSCTAFALTPKTDKGWGVESFGCVYLEAALFKKPVIGTLHYGIKEAVIDGKTGLLVEENNPKEIAAAIIKLFKNNKLRKTLGENGFKRTMQEFKDIESTKRLTSLYL